MSLFDCEIFFQFFFFVLIIYENGSFNVYCWYVFVFNWIDVFDVIGVGDMVVVVLILVLGVGVLIWEVVVIGNLAVSVVVCKFGMVIIIVDELWEILRVFVG